jgi:hypothetical protein
MKKSYYKYYFIFITLLFLVIAIFNIQPKENFEDKKNVKVVFKHLDGCGFFSTFNRLIEFLVHYPQNVTEIEFDVRASLDRWMPYIGENEELFSKLFIPYKNNTYTNETYVLDQFYNHSITHPRLLYNERRVELEPYNLAFKKYIKLQPNLENRLKRLEDELTLGYEQVVGIFVRSEALAGEQPSGKMPTRDDYLHAINSIDKTKKTRFFLRIDNEEDLNFYKTICVPYYLIDMKRSKTNKGDALHTNGTEYLLLKDLEDIYLDIALLSKCDILIHCVSNMSAASLFMNMNQKSICVSK